MSWTFDPKRGRHEKRVINSIRYLDVPYCQIGTCNYMYIISKA